MKKSLFTLLLFLTPYFIFAQLEVQNDNLIIELTKGKKVGFLAGSNSAAVGKGNMRVATYIEFTNTDPDKKRIIDLNKFSLVDHQSKKRYRGVDLAVGHPLGYKEGKRLTKKKLRVMNLNINYDPDVVDTFEDYTLEGYNNVERKTKLAVGKKYSSVIYYDHINRRVKRVQLFFAVPKKLKGNPVDIYYGKEKVGTFEI